MQKLEQPPVPAPPNVNIVFHWLGRFYFWLTGWKVVGAPPGYPKFVATAGPHTSNWDGLMMLCSSWIVRCQIDWMVKNELFVGPIGWFLGSIGGVPIDRRRGFNTVDQMLEQFENRERLALAIPPEGTRKKTDHWKTGFYWIAHEADVPIFIAYIDYERKEVNFESGYWKTTGDIEVDMPIIWEHFGKGKALYPEKVSDMRLRPLHLKRPKSRRTATEETETEQN